MAPGITVHPDELHVLAGELSALAAELDDGARSCRSASVRLRAALGGDEGWRAGALAAAWGALLAVGAARAGAVAATFVSATVAYREADAVLAEGMSVPQPRPHR